MSFLFVMYFADAVLIYYFPAVTYQAIDNMLSTGAEL